MREPDLFGGSVPGGSPSAWESDADEKAGSAAVGREPAGREGGALPLAARMRPRTLSQFRGQEHLLAEGKPLRTMIEEGEVRSLILWGPPGSGKTTLARLLAGAMEATFVPFSAVTEGIPRVREIMAEARERLKVTGRRTILFCDEIHRFNRAQQDAFLPHVEQGTVILIGATTENPSFEIVRPLLSRAPVFVLDPLTPEAIREIVVEAATDAERGLGLSPDAVEVEALDFISETADGDARRALNVLDAAASLARAGGHPERREEAVGGGRKGAPAPGDATAGIRIDLDLAREALQHRFAVYDKDREEHYNLISALHKSVRGSDPDAALYWLARMLEGGEDPLYLARRLVRMAAEDIGLADPRALGVTMAARDAYHFLGSPEGDLALAEAAVYLATAPKSVSLYHGWKAARDAARETPGAPVPLHLRNAPTDLMKELGYGAGYEYDPDVEHGVSGQRYLPERVGAERFFRPGPSGYEEEVRRRLAEWAKLRSAARAGEGEEPRNQGT